ncbi:hypothetical protein [Aquimarina brevivitae]|uniref:Uncharacterized protein n=1 Tax=Aquimarina brevivitae TaxID=323412 RepID=A0A4Q7P0L4_9FLAO|nr:hypothetical protein [Aquimarina brevivitae]RZS93336.1 hypothetical protein EV197_1914 [Aquimarina brevivitae]
MKIYKILSLVILLYTGTTESYGFNNCTITDLIEEMAMDNDVLETLDLSLRLTMAYSLGGSEMENLSKDIKKNLNTSISKLEIHKKEINKKFPRYGDLDAAERMIVMEGIAQKLNLKEKIKTLLKCIGEDLTTFGACMQASAWWENMSFASCLTVNGLGDIFAIATSEGAATPLVQAVGKEQVYWCAKFIYGKTGKECTLALVVAIVAEIFAGDCL